MATDITELSNGNIVVTGQSKRSSSNFTFNSWIMLLDRDGDSIRTWHSTFGETGSDGATAVAPCNYCGGFFAAGQGLDDLNRSKWWVAYFDSTGDAVYTYSSYGGGIHDAIPIGGGEFAISVAADYSFCVSRLGKDCKDVTELSKPKLIWPLYQYNGDRMRSAPNLYQLNGRFLPERLNVSRKAIQWLIDPEKRKIYLSQ